MTYVIEKNVPFEKPVRASRSKYPFDDMEIGDSFLAPGEKKDRVYAATNYYGKRMERTFAVSMTKDGVRVWRIK